VHVVLLDTNILVSAFINPKSKPAKLLAHWKKRNFDLVISDILLDEFSEVIRRPKIKEKYKISDKEIKELEKIILEKAIFVPAPGEVSLCRDPDDNVILETAILGKANYIVTGDKDIKTPELVEHLAQNKIKIITVGQYLKNLEKGK
jgi:putative PIN family toxin of toxin-antitoxin system